MLYVCCFCLDEPFTIFAPRNSVGGALDNHETLKSRPDLIKKLLLDHIVLGVKLDLSLKTAFTFTALGGRTVLVHRLNGLCLSLAKHY